MGTPRSKNQIQTFSAKVEKVSGMNGFYVSIPFNVKEVYGTNGMVKVKAKFDGQPYRGILSNMGTGSHIIIVRQEILKAINKTAGDSIKVEIQLDTEERVIELPEDLKQLFEKDLEAKTCFDKLSYTNKKEYCVWITSAKKDETRLKRVHLTIEKLKMGLKNPTDKLG